MSFVALIIIIIIIYRLFFKSDPLSGDRPYTPEELEEIKRNEAELAELDKILGPIEPYEPELEESDIEGVYFNEFGEYVDENGNVLTYTEVYEAKNRYDILEDLEEDYQEWRKSRK